MAKAEDSFADPPERMADELQSGRAIGHPTGGPQPEREALARPRAKANVARTIVVRGRVLCSVEGTGRCDRFGDISVVRVRPDSRPRGRSPSSRDSWTPLRRGCREGHRDGGRDP
jgi:hypothetical protein